MNSLKTIVVLGVLGAVAYGVYVSLHNKTPKSPSDPKAANTAVVSTPKVDLPKLNGSTTNGAATGRFSAPPKKLTTEADTVPPDINNPFQNSSRDSTNKDAGAPVTSAANSFPGASAAPRSPTGMTSVESPSGRPAAFNSAASDAVRGGNGAPVSAFQMGWKAAQDLLAQNKLAEAHLTLSMLYDEPSLSPTEFRQLRDLLDQLAGTVIYSTQHYLEPAYVVQTGDRLAGIAARYEIPPELLVKINGIENPNLIQPGTALKVVRGPFNAVIHQDRHELTLFVGGRYAGRFDIGIGRDTILTESSYQVKEKVRQPPYYGPNRQQIAPGEPDNPLGDRWIGLGGMAGIHGTNDSKISGRNDLRGCISLSPKDIDDVYDILVSDRSKITVRR